MLTTMLFGGVFKFDGKVVCAEFLTEAFGFSRDLQCGVKATPAARTPRGIDVKSRKRNRESKRDIVITFLSDLAETADRMPDADEVHLPFVEKQQVYDLFVKDWDNLGGAQHDEEPPRLSTFLNAWNKGCKNVKVRKVHRFAICGTCEQLERELANCGIDKVKAKPFRDKMHAHRAFLDTERQGYYKRRNEAFGSTDFNSVIIDGADQGAFDLPHFKRKTKEGGAGYGMKTKLVAVVEHTVGRKRVPNLYTMSEAFETGANHIIEALHRWVERKMGAGLLGHTLYVQADNCTRENKNRYFLAYLEILTAIVGGFREILVSFLPVGHTHEDVDQVFSCTSGRLRHHDAVTLEDLAECLSLAYDPPPVVGDLGNVANVSGMMESQECLHSIAGLRISTFRYYLFQRIPEKRQPDGSYAVRVTAKTNLTDSFQPLRPKRPGVGFLKHLPNFRDCPATITRNLEDLKPQVSKRLDAVDAQVGDRRKMEALRARRDHVYSKPRSIAMHWSPNCLELSWQVPSTPPNGNCDSEEEDDDELDEDEECPANLEYYKYDFVAVKPSPDAPEPFWIGLVSEVFQNGYGQVLELDVEWFQLRGTGKGETGDNQFFRGKYVPCTVQKGKKVEPLRSQVSPSMVFVKFDDLATDGRLHAATQKAIQASLTTEK